MKAALAWLTEPVASVQDETDRQRSRTLLRLLVAMLPITGLMGVVSAAVRDQPLGVPEILVAICLFLGGTSSLLLGRYGYGGAGAAVVSLTAIVGGVMVAFVEVDPVRAVTSSLFGLTGVVYASFLFAARRAAFFVLLAVLAQIVVLFHPSVAEAGLVLPVFLSGMVGSLLVAGTVTRERHLALVKLGEARLRATFDSALDAVFVVDERGTLKDANRPAIEMFSASSEALPDLSRNPELARRLTALAATGSAGHFEMELTAASQHVFPAEVSVAPLVVTEARGLCVFVRDLTERRRFEVELLRNDRLVSVGRLAAGVAHEINNPLSYVVTNLQVVDASLGDGNDELHEMIADALDGAGRVRDIVAELTVFSRGQEEAPSPVDLHAVVDVVAQLAANPIRHNAKLVRRLDDVPPVLAASGRLAQVLLNLVLNAVQSRPPGRSTPVTVVIEAAAQGADEVALRVRDDGPGIAPEVCRQLFSPFFTTKRIGEGTGLGLYLSRDIVRGMGGELSLEATSASGTTFLLRLPRATSLPVAVEPRPLQEIRFERVLGVLLVDDDPGVARAVERCLPEHSIRRFTDAESALSALDAGGTFDLAVLDVMMPGTDGLALARQLVERGWSASRVLLVTGAVFPEFDADALVAGGFIVVRKPVDRVQLRTAVRDAVVSPAAQAQGASS